MTNSVPVMEAARGEAIKAIKSATSAGFAGFPIGIPPSVLHETRSLYSRTKKVGDGEES